MQGGFGSGLVYRKEKRRQDRAASDQCSSPSSASASPLIYGNVWSRWSIIVRWTLTVKISQVLVAGGARGRPGSNHYGFTPLMMGRELIYLGEKQIKALLGAALRHTIAYINILSWAIQVSKGLVHLHFHKGLLSMLWPLLPFSALLLMSACCPLLHLPVFLLSLSSLISPSSSRVFLGHERYYSSRALLLLNSCCVSSTLFLHLLQFLNSKKSKYSF